jgi:hypothetical protein
MIDNSHKLKTIEEKLAYHKGWIDGMNNASKLRDKIDKEARLKIIKEKHGKN